MKPPPRTRNKPDRNLNPNPEPTQSRQPCAWSRKEQKMLLDALRRQGSSCGGGSPGNIDYSLLKKDVPSRSDSEIRSVVQRLQDKVISGAILQLKTRTLAEKKMAPIHTWTRLARVVSGSFDGPLSKAFSQIWTVASTEPHTLRNCQPPRLEAAQSDTRDCTAPLGPAPAQVPFKSPVASTGPAPAPVIPVEQPSLSGMTASKDFKVDFERIYNYLSGVHNPEGECELTATESAIVLDLVMSLPEELGLLRCQSLRQHLIQAHQNLSEAEDSEKARKVLTELESKRQGSDQESQQNVEDGAIGPASGSGEPAWTGLCPPLNPFMIPLELLKRRSDFTLL
ncbi:snRNA-activating protein complex subunit 2 isoform X1 [Hippocampus comes]|uniref:Small nuclear RNA activating complex polypeptide 2 n=1 Tax=Hippocampus comes TaxID=109280 RepID=A0A3Q3D3R3_HIPCM|nr:PREDICTED: snRNA-activating protein complex subunit 2 isoform X1 [Hippocampus comes]